MTLSLPPEHSARRYAQALLSSLGSARAPSVPPQHPAVAAAHCGLLALSGDENAASQLCPAPLAAAADGVLAALKALAPDHQLADVRGAQLITERAAIFAHQRRGRVSAGGSCRVLDCKDGAIAVNLARDDDWDLLPAWLQREVPQNWEALTQAARDFIMHDLVEDGRLLGLAVAPVVPPPSRPPPWCAGALPQIKAEPRARAPRVLDLSSLWAGPLCSHLLLRCGADVVKLESTQRPDGARRGPPDFFALMNAGKRSVALDFASRQGRAELQALIARADIVIEASRPRALRQLGVDAEALIRARPDLTWISLTGYGRGEPQENWIAYGDDAGVASGLSFLMRRCYGQPWIVGDAIADPFTGLHAALAAWAGWRAGGGGLLALSLVDVLRHVIGFEAPADAAGWRARAQQWSQLVENVETCAPHARAAYGCAPALNQHRAQVWADWGVAC
ncbi:CoA transferase [Sinimarinibacterium sp. NLF-5-8]|uniref:CoA transferase n=1 Tax=Sinimarinibacterium sp. NLF-5-8 TaxID=2698684 RepID=UPI00137C24DF|nr:CoA transferase [Sinimarinibacterium sp. NLF-5-8]QHS09328.1 CoA transferase [Sinimarinibacterium sp. NLF-5-8]